MTATAMPVSIDVLARQHPANGIFKVRLRAATGLNQRDASSRMRNKHMTQSVAAITTEVKDWLGEISDNASSGMHLHDIGVHVSIIAAAIIPTGRQSPRAGEASARRFS